MTYFVEKTIRVCDSDHGWKAEPYDDGGVKVSYFEGEERESIEIACPNTAILVAKAMIEVAEANIAEMKRLGL